MSDASIELPSTPPVAGANSRSRTEEMPGEVFSERDTSSQNEITPWYKSTVARIGGGVAAVAFVGGGLFFAGRNSVGEGGGAASTTVVEREFDSEDYDCPAGIFNEGPFAGSEAALPLETHVRPEESLTDVESLMDYWFGLEGEACNSAPLLAVLTATYTEYRGANGEPFDDVNANSVLQKLISNPEFARSAVDMTADATAHAKSLEEDVSGTWFQAALDDNGEIYLVPISDFYVEAGQGFDLDSTIMGDNISDSQQRIVVPKDTGQVFLEKSEGYRVMGNTEDQAEQGGGQDQEGDQQADQQEGQEGGGGSGTGAGTGGGGEGGEGGGCGATCGHGGGEEGGVCDTCGAGGGQQPTGPGGPGGPTPTRPPAPNPPTTQPNGTSTTTTSQPEPDKSPDPGCPPGSPSWAC